MSTSSPVRSDDLRDNNLHLFENHIKPSSALTVINQVLVGAGGLVITTVSALYWITKLSEPVEDFDCCCPPITFEDTILLFFFWNAFGALVGLALYSSRNLPAGDSMKEITDDKTEQESASMSVNIQSNESCPLSNVKIAAPCTAEWKLMHGNDRARFCGKCNLSVYNLSAMSKEEAEDLIVRTEGRLCVRFYRREDGTILTQNCPVGVKAFKEKLSHIRVHLIGAALSFITLLGFLGAYSLLPLEKESLIGDSVKLEPGGELPLATWVEGPFQGGCVVGPTEVVWQSEESIRERAVFRVIPVYHLAGGGCVKGDVRVRIIVSAGGMVVRANVIEGHPLLRDIAEGAAYRWKFEPVASNGKPTVVEGVLTFHFGQ